MIAGGGEGRRSQLTLYGVMLMSAVGTASVQSLLPGMGRSLGIPDAIIGLSFALSAIIFTMSGPYWGQRVAYHGARRLVLIGQFGIAMSMIVCGICLTLGATGFISGIAAFIGFIAGRAIYGVLGSAAQPAVQAIVVASNAREKRVAALSLLASAFGLGTIIGPAMAPFLIMPVIGFAGPPLTFGLAGLLLLAAIGMTLRDVPTAGVAAMTQNLEPGATSEPSAAEIAAAADAKPVIVKVRYTDSRVLPWLLCGLVAMHAQAMSSQTMGFLVIDRLGMSPVQAQPFIGMVLMIGACAMVAVQWGLVPRIKAGPRRLLLGGGTIAMVGLSGVALAKDLPTMTASFALASLGFGIFRPGYTAGISLAVGEAEQGAAAGLITANNAAVFILGPAIGIWLYGAWRPLPYLLSALALAVMLGLAWRSAALSRAARGYGQPVQG